MAINSGNSGIGIFPILLLILAAGCTHGKYVDLTYALNKDVVLWPGRTITFNTELEGEIPGIGWAASRGFCISEHTSTHIDAPYHVYKDGKTLDGVALDTLLNVHGVLIDIYNKVHPPKSEGTISNYVLTRKDILEWEQKHGEIPPNSLVLLRTGWGELWQDAEAYKGFPRETESSTDPAPNSTFGSSDSLRLNFPGFDASAAIFLTSERSVVGVGIDTLSIDAGAAKTFPAHKIFGKRGVYMLENVANLHLLPATGFRVFVVPFKIDLGTGAPTRVIADVRGSRKPAEKS